jgi:hypothetical protein
VISRSGESELTITPSSTPSLTDWCEIQCGLRSSFSSLSSPPHARMSCRNTLERSSGSLLNRARPSSSSRGGSHHGSPRYVLVRRPHLSAVSSSLPTGGPERSKPPPSDPSLEGEIAEWSDRLLPDRPLRFLAEGKIQARAWAALAEQAVACFDECDLELAEVRTPPYTRKDRKLLGAQPGYGWIVGEAELRPAEFGLLETKGYRSFIAAIQAWTDPAIGKREPDTEQTPHAWNVRVRAGRVHSVEVLSRYHGAVRQFRGTTDTDEAYGWIAKEILTRLSGTSP